MLLLVRMALVAMLPAALALGAAPERSAPPKSTAHGTRLGGHLPAHDLAGRPRDRRLGITPGALEAEGPPAQRKQKRRKRP